MAQAKLAARPRIEEQTRGRILRRPPSGSPIRLRRHLHPRHRPRGGRDGGRDLRAFPSKDRLLVAVYEEGVRPHRRGGRCGDRRCR